MILNKMPVKKLKEPLKVGLRKRTSKLDGSNFFDGKKMMDYFNSLPIVDDPTSTYLRLKKPIAIMTHDDVHDPEFEKFETENGFTSTTFIFQHKINKDCLSAKTDLQLHYNRLSYLSLSEQIENFKQKLNQTPRINRNHRLWWRESHLDLAHLAMEGIQVDSTLVGFEPFRLVAEQRILPIWEVPFSIVDHGAVSVTNSASCAYNLATNMESLFVKGITPIVALFHPYLKRQSKWKEFFFLAEKYGYAIMNMSQFKGRYLKLNGKKNRNKQE